MEDPKNLNHARINQLPETIEEVEAEIRKIDEEIVRQGENIPRGLLETLTKRKGIFAKKLAGLKGERIEKGDTGYSL